MGRKDNTAYEKDLRNWELLTRIDTRTGIEEDAAVYMQMDI